MSLPTVQYHNSGLCVPAGVSGAPENTNFPMTESPPPGYITDDGDGVSSPGSNISSNGEFCVFVCVCVCLCVCVVCVGVRVSTG